jgi:hypothetical protein
MKRIYTTPQTPTRGQTLGRPVSDCGAYGIAEHMAERQKSEIGCARLLDLLRQAHGESRPDLVPVRVRAGVRHV